MGDDIFIDTILEAQAIAKLMQLLDSTELVKALAKRGYSSKAFE